MKSWILSKFCADEIYKAHRAGYEMGLRVGFRSGEITENNRLREELSHPTSVQDIANQIADIKGF